jgi:hypothetical protein
MARRLSSLGFLGRVGRSHDLRLLDAALRAVDLHPALVPEGAKLAIVNMMKDAWPGREPPEDAYPPVAHLFGYCLVGPDLFAEANGPEATAAAEAQIEAALAAGEGMDADLVLLALHARLASPKVVQKFDLSAEEE